MRRTQYFMTVILVLVLTSACAPLQNAVQTTTVKTEIVGPPLTPVSRPVSTPLPTYAPMPRRTVTPDITRIFNQQNITTVLAVLSFILTSILGINEIRRYSSRVRVRIREGYYFIKSSDNKSEKIIAIEVTNVGFGVRYIDAGGWLLKDGSKIGILYPFGLVLPAKLEEHRSISFYYPCHWLHRIPNTDKIVGAYASDETGRIYKSRLSKRNLGKLLSYQREGWLIGTDELGKKYYRKGPNGTSIPLEPDGFITSKIK